ncbi:hypothetical protein TDB9533_00258 [Thalassocella blandensis]|nr:hypothetical protein TDB9533_00258 [Thalassocella blandensis]
MQWIPQNHLNQDNHIRRVGVEIEFAGLSLEQITQAIVRQYGGTTQIKTLLEARVENTSLGDFTVELDAQYFKDLAKSKLPESDSNELENTTDDGLNLIEQLSMEIISEDFLAKAASQFVPWEIVSPPVPVDQLHQLQMLVTDLREAGALGTRHSPVYAFGVHLNPELPALDSGTIVRYLKAYFCLYEWIYERENVDFSRRITPYINHFDKKYIEKVLDTHYFPDLNLLVSDYLQDNPTRNRSLDLLPLFRFLDEAQVTQSVDDPRIKSRPTFHYRLPNCDIDNPTWNIHVPWQHWLEVEALANNKNLLTVACQAYLHDLQRLTRSFDSRWLDKIKADILRLSSDEE